MATSFLAAHRAIAMSGIDTGKSTTTPLAGGDGIRLLRKLLVAAKGADAADLGPIAQVFTACVTITLGAIAGVDDGPGFAKLQKLQKVARAQSWTGHDYANEMAYAVKILRGLGTPSAPDEVQTAVSEASLYCQKLAHEARVGRNISVPLMSKIVARLSRINAPDEEAIDA